MSWGNNVDRDENSQIDADVLPNQASTPMLRRMGDAHADAERAALLALLDERPTLPGERRKASWPDIASEVSLRGSAISLWEELHPPVLEGMDEAGGLFARARGRLKEWMRADFELVTVLDAEYPVALRTIREMPPLLFVKGKLLPDEVGVSVVGSRDATQRGRSIAANVAKGLVERNIAVISGLAAGIDTAAHEATLEVSGRPIGVLGTGINRVSPTTAKSRELHEYVAAAGVLVSQFFPDAWPTKQTFPMRNVIMSGLGQASIIIEASELSGTRIQARVAVEHGRPVILTDLVVNGTNWGKSMRDRPGVYVAGSTAEVMSIVERVTMSRDDELAIVSAPGRAPDPGPPVDRQR